MLNHDVGPWKFLLIGLFVFLGYQYRQQAVTIDAEAIAREDKWFERYVHSEMGPVLLKFGSDGCPPCRSLDANLKKIEPSLSGRIAVVRADVGHHPGLASTFGVCGIPHTFVLYRGKVIDQKRGGMDKDTLTSWINAALDKAYRQTNR